MKIIMVGSSGAMGRTIIQNLQSVPGHEIVAGFQADDQQVGDFPVFQNFSDLQNALNIGEITADVIIDFSTPILTQQLVKFASSSKLPLLLATTGQSREQIAYIQDASRYVAILDTHNTSIGVAVLTETLKSMTRTLYPLGYDIEIIEKHHRYKKDAPSGTALMLKAALESAIDQETQTIFGRQGISEGRPHHEIAVHAVRAGDIVGEHTVIFANNQETIEITHRAGSKELFAKGALQCAQYIMQQKPGLYSMEDVMKG